MILLQLAALDPRRAGRSPGSNARRPYNDGTCRTASGRRPGRNRERSGRTRRPRSSSAAPSRDRAGWSARRGTGRWRAGRRGRLASISLASRAAARIASGWISSPWRSASANIWISRTGSSREEIVVGDGEPAAVEHEAFELARAAAEGGQAEAAAAAGELLVEMGEEHAGQVADRLRVQEIVAHEALDRRSCRAGRHSSSAPRSRADSRRSAAPRRGRRRDGDGSAPPTGSARRAGTGAAPPARTGRPRPARRRERSR